MPKLILCEGRTDAILISYYLAKTAGWLYLKNGNCKDFLTRKDDNEELNWYRKNDESLCVWGCGGINNIPTKLNEVVDRNKNEIKNSNLFNKIAIIIDHDTRTQDENKTLIQGWIAGATIQMPPANFVLGNWGLASYDNQQGKQLHLQILPMVLPSAATGNLESFLLGAIKANGGEEEAVVDQAQTFIDNLAAVSFIQKHRYKGKAQLGTALSVFSPERVFTEEHARLTAIDWTQYDAVNTAFAVLKSI